jgi:hypothetical protein
MRPVVMLAFVALACGPPDPEPQPPRQPLISTQQTPLVRAPGEPEARLCKQECLTSPCE